MEDIDGGLHPAVDGQSLDEDEDDEEMGPVHNVYGDKPVATREEVATVLL